MNQKKKCRPTKNSPVTQDGYQIPYYPVGDRIVAERTGEDQVVTKAGLIIPPRATEELSFGTLIAAGLQAQDKLHSMGIQIGDTISWGKWAGIHWDWNPPQEEGSARIRATVDILNVADILGSSQLCDDIMSGDAGIELFKEADGAHRHRLFRVVEPPKEVTPTEDGNYVGTPETMTVADVEQAIKDLRREHGIAHLRQDTAEMERLQGKVREFEQIKNMARRGEV